MDEDDEDDAEPQQASGTTAPAEPYTGPRTLDGRPAPQPVSAPAPASRAAPPRRTGVATLGSLGGGDDDHSHDEDDSEDEADRPRDLFAGGEKSGLAVQDPSKKNNDPKSLVNQILKKARE